MLRIAFYLIGPDRAALGQVEPGGLGPTGRLPHTLAFGALAFFMVMTLKFTRRQKGFKATPMDFLILVIALVVPNLPDPSSQLRMGELAVKIIVMFFGFEVLIGRAARQHGPADGSGSWRAWRSWG